MITSLLSLQFMDMEFIIKECLHYVEIMILLSTPLYKYTNSNSIQLVVHFFFKFTLHWVVSPTRVVTETV